VAVLRGRTPARTTEIPFGAPAAASGD
jgi:hypothetical protein